MILRTNACGIWQRKGTRKTREIHMTNTIILIFELIGTIAFSISGAMVAIRKRMDIFGIAILGLTTAVGGGVIRDLILGITPPATFRHPVYAITALATAFLIFIPAVRRGLEKKHAIYDRFLLIMDSVGLGIFTVVGVQAAFSRGYGDNLFLAVFVGTLTGGGGGVMRDMMAGDRPYIFVKHFYATSSLIGAVVTALIWTPLGGICAMAVGTILTTALRMLAAKYRWSLPKP